MTRTKIWRFSDPLDGRFASAGRRGAWTEAQPEGVCPSCGSSQQVRAQPLLMTWEPGPDVVGDFTWPGFDSEIAATSRALAALEGFSGFEAGPVEIVDDEAPNASGRSRPNLTGNSLKELLVTAIVGMDRERSSAELEHQCRICSRERWIISGVERWDSHFDPDTKRLDRVRSNRLPGAGIYVSHAELSGAGVFRVSEFPAWVFCIDSVRDAVAEHVVSNVSFLEMGETF